MTRRPEPPHPAACCQGNCVPCVFDLYEQELRRWEAARRAPAHTGRDGASPAELLRRRMDQR